MSPPMTNVPPAFASVFAVMVIRCRRGRGDCTSSCSRRVKCYSEPQRLPFFKDGDAVKDTQSLGLGFETANRLVHRFPAKTEGPIVHGNHVPGAKLDKSPNGLF